MDSLELSIKNMILEDPIIVALWNNSMAWGDIPGILDVKSSSDVEKEFVLVEPYVSKSNESVGIKTVITRNLPRDITVEQLRHVFERYGPIKDIYIPKNMDRTSPYFGTLKGFALIKFLTAKDAMAAYENEYGHLVMGRNKITVEFAKADR